MIDPMTRTAAPSAMNEQPEPEPTPATEAISRHYWAMQPRTRLGQAVRAVFERYQRELNSRGWSERINASWLRYHGYDPDGGPSTSSDVMIGGEQGELDLVQENHYRSLVRSMLSLATSSRPAFRAAATDDSAESMAACHLAEQVWEHELERGLETVAREGGEKMLVESEVDLLATWDSEAGEIVGAEDIHEYDDDGNPVMDDVEGPPDPMTGAPTMTQQPRKIGERPIYRGDIVYEALSPQDCARDLQCRRLRDVKWVVVRRVLSRWDLCATYDDDEAVREIVSASGPPQRERNDRERNEVPRDGDDQCYVLELYHASTPAVPGGRYARVVGEYVLEEGPLPYDRVPVIMKAPSEVLGQALGYTDAWDLLGLAKLLDAAMTNLASEANRHGQRPVLMPEGCDVSPAELTGPGVINVPVGADGRPLVPMWMEVPKVEDSAIKWIEFLQNQMQVLSGINSVVRGDPEASLKSGAALALVQAMAVQHNSAFQASWAELLRELATLVIDIYKVNAKADRLIDIVGDDEVGTVQSFVGEDLAAVRRIRAELGNPLMRTIAGKKELADYLSAPGNFDAEPPLTRTQYIGFLSSGRLDPLFRADRSEAIGIKSECEALARGEEVPVLITDCHEKHIREHKALLDGKQRMKLDPAAINAITQHVTEHVMQWVQLTVTNPALLAATGQQPAPMAPMMGPPGAEGAPPGGPPGAPANDNGSGPPRAANDNAEVPLGPPQGGAMAEPVIPGTEPAGMPSAPINPATGQRATLPDGAVQ